MNLPQHHAVLCPNCRKLVSSDEARCPYCGLANPGAGWRHFGVFRGFQDPNRTVSLLIWANVVMFAISILMNPSRMNLSLNPLGFLSPHNDVLLLLGATGTYPIDKLHRWWSLISANYLHGGLLHILFNMMALRQLAPFAIREYGFHRMFIIYTVSGIIGYFVSYLAGVILTIGASAALCGLIGATLYYGKSRGGIYGQAVYRQVSGWVVGLFVFGLLFPGINNWGHGGGILGGIGTAFILGYTEKNKEKMVHRYLATFFFIVTVGVLVWAITTGVYYRFLI